MTLKLVVCLLIFYLLMRSLATDRAYRQGAHPWVIRSCVFSFFYKYVIMCKGSSQLVVQEAEVFFCDIERRDGLGLECLVLEDEGGPVDTYERAGEWV